MLIRLSIRNIVLIERLDIDFSAGLSVLTGETGAGKSILLDSLALALGGRGDGSVVRKGEVEGSITAVFEIETGHPVHALLADNELPEDDLLILRRVQRQDGKTRGFVNDAPASAGLMRAIGQLLVEIHGQHDDRAMLDIATHCGLLDAHGGLEASALLVSKAWKTWKESESQLSAIRLEVENARREADYLRAASKELTLLAPEPGEEGELADRRQRMMKLQQVAADLSEANEELSGNGSPVTVIANLARRLERKRQQVAELVDETLDHLDAALNALYLAQDKLENAFRETRFDRVELETSEERLFALRAAARKYNVAVENLPDLAVQLADGLTILEEGEGRFELLDKETRKLREAYFELAKELSLKRGEAASVLEAQVCRELPFLKLEQSAFMVHRNCGEELAGPTGIDQIEFWVQTNPGSNPGQMRKVASGGELSRFMLALKVALAERGSAPTLIFDEIDSGVGGAVADAIGQRLTRLSNRVQVLSVTHAPQVAARATGHYLISKSVVANETRTATAVERMSKESRLEEIARMLSGATITDEARAAAEKLVDQSAV